MQQIEAIEGIGKQWAARLRALDITTVEGLLEQAAYPKDRRALARKIASTLKKVTSWAVMADLFRINGVASEYAELLHAAGMQRVDDLVDEDAVALTAAMKEIADKTNIVRVPPSLKRVRSWIKQAKQLETQLFYDDPSIPAAPGPLAAALAGKSAPASTAGEKVGFNPAARQVYTRNNTSLLDWFVWFAALGLVIGLSALVVRNYQRLQSRSGSAGAPVIERMRNFGKKLPDATSTTAKSKDRSREAVTTRYNQTKVVSDVISNPATSEFARYFTAYNFDNRIYEQEGEVTVIAPSNQAVRNFMATRSGAFEEQEEFIARHILIGEVNDVSFATNQTVTALSGMKYQLSIDDAQKGGLQLVAGQPVFWQGTGLYTTLQAL